MRPLLGVLFPLLISAFAAGEIHAAPEAVSTFGPEKSAGVAERPAAQSRQRRPAAPSWLIPAGYLAIVPLYLAAGLAGRAGRKRLAHGLRFGLVLLPTAAALAPVLGAASLPLSRQAFPDTHEYADVARNLVALEGFVTTVHRDEPHPSRYPPGFSLALVPFTALGGEYPAGAQLGAKAYAAGYVLAAVGTAWVIGGPLAAAFAAVLVGISPFARQSAATIMSDALGAALMMLVVALIHHRSRDGASLAGLLGGALAVVRFSAAITTVALILALPRRLWPRVLLFAAPSLVGLALFHWLVFGSPLRTGYDYWLPGLKNFDPAFALDNGTMRDGTLFADALDGQLMRWTCPCPQQGPQAALPHLFFYPAVLTGLYWVFAPPLATLPGLIFAWTRRGWPSARFALWLTALNLAFFSIYFYQGTRFLAGPATLLAVFSAVWAAQLVDRLAHRLPYAGAGDPARTWRSTSCA